MLRFTRLVNRLEDVRAYRSNVIANTVYFNLDNEAGEAKELHIHNLQRTNSSRPSTRRSSHSIIRTFMTRVLLNFATSSYSITKSRFPIMNSNQYIPANDRARNDDLSLLFSSLVRPFNTIVRSLSMYCPAQRSRHPAEKLQACLGQGSHVSFME